ncbi:MAG: LPS-assembly protein LptD [Bacteroidota bacterium]|nr:LPS-assembly protein LptD [Bacteroidota bacterium]
MTVESKGKNNFYPQFQNYLPDNSDTNIPSKENHFSVAEKQNILKDTLPQKNKISADTILSLKTDSLSKKDISASRKNTDTLHYKLAKNALEAPLEYTAEDSMVLDVHPTIVTLYGKKATTDYKDNALTAPVISFDQASGDIIASIKRDSAGKVIALPTYKQADFTSQSDSIRFNMKSGKGITKSTYTQQGEMYVYGQVIKKVDNNVFYALRGRFTTCNLDTPHFAFISNKIKFITNKLAITGPMHPEFEGIPIPIYLPFGIFPLNQGRHSGFLAPNFTSNEQRGIGLEGLGYYKVINEYWDVIFRSSIYSYGGWSLNINPRYLKKYHYSGNLAFDVQNFNINFKGDPDFIHNRSYHIAWSHSADTKSRPGVTFMASVNAGSSSYNSQVPNNPQLNISNQLTSSIAYSKTWKDKPFNLTLTANHDQNTNLKLINVSLPSVGFNVSTIYPFRKKESVGDLKWYENIGIAYNGTAQNRFSFYDTVKNKSIFQQIRDTFQWGAHHSVPITLSLPQIGAFQLAPFVSYDETWYQKKVTRSWDNTKDTLLTNIEKGFYAARQMSFGLNLSTRIFGMIAAKSKDAKIQAIRHEIRPTFGISYQPDFNSKNYYFTQVDTSDRKQQFSHFESGYNLYSPYSPGRFGGFNFGLENNISMKVRNKKDTGENSLKKISILDNLSILGSYNLFADSLNFSDITMTASTNLFNKINVTASALFDPYEVNNQGTRINKLIWGKNPISLGRLTNGSISLSSSFQGGNKKTGDKSGLKPNNIPLNAGYSQDEYNSEMAYIRNDPGEFANFNIPWSVNFSYSLQFSKTFATFDSAFKSSFTQNINFGGTINLTSKWQMGINGYYNISLGQLNPLTLSISRDLHCWQMSINVSPVGYNRFYSINISPKSPLLRDLKINRTKQIYTGL